MMMMRKADEEEVPGQKKKMYPTPDARLRGRRETRQKERAGHQSRARKKRDDYLTTEKNFESLRPASRRAGEDLLPKASEARGNSDS